MHSKRGILLLVGMILLATSISAQENEMSFEKCQQYVDPIVTGPFFNLTDFDFNIFDNGPSGSILSPHNFGLGLDAFPNYRYDYKYAGELTDYSFSKRHTEWPKSTEYQLILVHDLSGVFQACIFGQIVPFSGATLQQISNDALPPGRSLVMSDANLIDIPLSGLKDNPAYAGEQPLSVNSPAYL